jgi:predicted TIM-barrel fold metal-dependent hydrolase
VSRWLAASAMRVDAHAHVWQPVTTPPTGATTIVSGQCAVPTELLLDYLDEHGIDRAVLVQPVYPGYDNSYVADAAREHSDRLSAVCVIDPRQPTAADSLAHWVVERGCRGLRLRPCIAAEVEVFGSRSTWPVWQTAQQLGIVVNVLANQEHLPALGDLAERFPGVPIVIDHFAHPRLPGSVAQVASRLLALAQYANVHLKMSGYYYFSRGRFPYDDSRELVRAVYDAFGPARLLWGSDFPHVLLKTGYGRILRHAECQFDWFTDDDRQLILGDNARRLYWPDAS